MSVAVQNKVVVPYAALGEQTVPIKKELMAAFEAVLDSGQYILGPSVSRFEAEFASYCNSPFATGVSNGTTALFFVLKCIGIKEGDEVITAPNSFIASAAAIALTGAKPVFADVGDDMNIDPAQIEKAITPRTRVLMPVHLTGRPARMKEILAIAKKHNLFVLEDAAQAVGARLDNKKVGAWGDAACFSLHPLKNLHAFGDAGMITTTKEEIYKHLALMRNHGLKNRDECEFFSYNGRLDDLQAAVLSVQIRHLDAWTEERRRLARIYNDAFRPYVITPEERQGEYCVYQTYMIRGQHRDELRQYLNENGVQASVHYAIPIPFQKAAHHLGYKKSDFPNTVKIASEILSLPLYPGLSKEKQDLVISLIVDFYKKRGIQKH